MVLNKRKGNFFVKSSFLGVLLQMIISSTQGVSKNIISSPSSIMHESGNNRVSDTDGRAYDFLSALWSSRSFALTDYHEIYEFIVDQYFIIFIHAFNNSVETNCLFVINRLESFILSSIVIQKISSLLENVMYE